MRRFCFGRLVGLVSGGVLAGVASAANLVGNGDFAADGEKAGANYRATGGTFAVFTETPSWNRCGKYVLGGPTTSKDGEVCSMGYVFCGYDPASKLAGFKAEPDTSYAFSFEIRGVAPSVSVAFYEWDGPDFWNDGHKGETSVKSVTPKKDEWTLVKGTFRTSQKAQRAALRFGLYSSTKYKMKPLPAGTSYLIDNVKVEPVKNRLASAGEAKEVPVRKAFATADGGMLSDFCMMKGSLLKPTSVTVSQSAKGLVFDVSCRGQDAVTHAKGDRLWTADSFEILFGDPAAPSVKLLQFAFNVDGQKYVSDGSTALGWNDRWSVATKTCADGWEAKVEIPYATLGYERSPQAGMTIPFNVSREVRATKEWYAWSRVRTDSRDLKCFGTLVFGSYAEGFAARWGKPLKGEGRVAFETETVTAEKAAAEAKFAKFKAGRFSLAPVNPCADMTVPFLPDEVFDPPTNLTLRACVNEVKALPLALANLTEEAAEYRVILETEPEERKDDGDFGLKGFPAEQIVCRMGIRMKETDAPPVTLRFDPLVRMNEINTVMVPPREAGLVWFDFDTTGVKPGIYKGRIRVLPLGEPGQWKCVGGYNDRQYVGVGRTVPVSLEVVSVELSRRPVRPTMLCGKADTESCYRLMSDLGATDFAISPWYFQFHRQANGDLDLSRPKEGVQAARRDIRNHKAWSAKFGEGRPHFLVMYSTYETMEKIYNPKDKDEALRLWVQYLKGVHQVMREENVRDDEFMVEAWDEPPNAEVETVFAVLSLAKRELPQVRMQLTLGCAPQHGFEPKNFERLTPYVDNWENWRYGYFSIDNKTVMKVARAHGAKLSHYSCGTSLRESCYFTFRLMPWFGERWKLDADGLYQFADGAGGNCRSSFKSTTHGEIVYRTFDTFVPSVRYMAIREGQTDIRYLEALKRLRGDDPVVKEFLRKAPRQVFDEGPHDITIAPRLRQQALDLILKGK